jgi:hypothetical protein
MYEKLAAELHQWGSPLVNTAQSKERNTAVSKTLPSIALKQNETNFPITRTKSRLTTAGQNFDTSLNI